MKQLPIGVTDAFLYDLFRPFGPLANVRSEAGFGPDIGVVEFWREEDARRAEEAMVRRAMRGTRALTIHSAFVSIVPRWAIRTCAF